MDDQLWLEFKGTAGPGLGRRVVLVSGDEEYRSEEALPMLAKILSTHHGFDCSVLFAINPETGEIDPDCQTNIPGLHALDTADLMIIFVRFRELPDEADEAHRGLRQFRTPHHRTENGDSRLPVQPRHRQPLRRVRLHQRGIQGRLRTPGLGRDVGRSSRASRIREYSRPYQPGIERPSRPGGSLRRLGNDGRVRGRRVDRKPASAVGRPGPYGHEPRRRPPSPTRQPCPLPGSRNTPATKARRRVYSVPLWAPPPTC